MDQRYDILESISQREDGTMLEENAVMVHVANVIGRAAKGCLFDEEKCSGLTLSDQYLSCCPSEIHKGWN